MLLDGLSLCKICSSAAVAVQKILIVNRPKERRKEHNTLWAYCIHFTLMHPPPASHLCWEKAINNFLLFFFLHSHFSCPRAYAWVNLCVSCRTERLLCHQGLSLYSGIRKNCRWHGGLKEEEKEAEGLSLWVLIDPSRLDRQRLLSTLTPASLFALGGGKDTNHTVTAAARVFKVSCKEAPLATYYCK